MPIVRMSSVVNITLNIPVLERTFGFQAKVGQPTRPELRRALSEAGLDIRDFRVEFNGQDTCPSTITTRVSMAMVTFQANRVSFELEYMHRSERHSFGERSADSHELVADYLRRVSGLFGFCEDDLTYYIQQGDRWTQNGKAAQTTIGTLAREGAFMLQLFMHRSHSTRRIEFVNNDDHSLHNVWGRETDTVQAKFDLFCAVMRTEYRDYVLKDADLAEQTLAEVCQLMRWGPLDAMRIEVEPMVNVRITCHNGDQTQSSMQLHAEWLPLIDVLMRYCASHGLQYEEMQVTLNSSIMMDIDREYLMSDIPFAMGSPRRYATIVLTRLTLADQIKRLEVKLAVETAKCRIGKRKFDSMRQVHQDLVVTCAKKRRIQESVVEAFQVLLDEARQKAADAAADEADRVSASAEQVADAEASAAVLEQRCAGFKRSTVELLRQKMAELGEDVPAAAGGGAPRPFGDCVICLNAQTEKTHACVPCGHTAFCGETCSNLVVGGPCPVCRVPVTQVIALF